MKKFLLLLAFLVFNLTNAQVNLDVNKAKVNEITVDVIHVGDYLPISYMAFPALGSGGHVEVYGNLAEGRIDITTGIGSTGKTPCRIVFPDGYNLGTDNATVFITSYSGKFFEVQAVAVEGNGFEIYSKELWEDSSFYEFRYFIISHIQ